MRDPQEVAAVLGITPHVIQARQASIRLDPAECQLLRSPLPVVEPLKGGILDRLYQRLLEHPETASLFVDELQIVRLKTQMSSYLHELFDSEIDWPYVLRRLWIGVTHHRVHLKP